jgi:hypothetical protein
VVLRARVSACLDHGDFLRLAACDRESLRVSALPAASCAHMTLDYRGCDAAQGTRLRAQPTSIVLRFDHAQADVRLAMLAQLPHLRRVRFELDRPVGMETRYFQSLARLATLDNFCSTWRGGDRDLLELAHALPSLTWLSFRHGAPAARAWHGPPATRTFSDVGAPAIAAAAAADDAPDAAPAPDVISSVYERLLHLDAPVTFADSVVAVAAVAAADAVAGEDTRTASTEATRGFRRHTSLTSLVLRHLNAGDPDEIEVALEALPNLVRLRCHDMQMNLGLGADAIAALLRGPRLPHLRELHLIDCHGLNRRSQAPFLLEAIAQSAPSLEALSVTVSDVTGALVAVAERNGMAKSGTALENRRLIAATRTSSSSSSSSSAGPTQYERNEMLRWHCQRQRYRNNIAAHMGDARVLSELTHLERVRLEAGPYTLGGGQRTTQSHGQQSSPLGRGSHTGVVVPGRGATNALMSAFAVARLPRVRELQLSAHYDLSEIVAPLLTHLALTQPLRIGSRGPLRATTVADSGSGDAASGDAAASSSSDSGSVFGTRRAASPDIAPDIEFGFARRLPALETLCLDSLQVWPRRSLPTLVAHKNLRAVWVGDMRLAVADIRIDHDGIGDGIGDDGATASITAREVAEWRAAGPRLPTEW